METETSQPIVPSQPTLLTQPFTPKISHTNITATSKTTNRNYVTTPSRISYNVKEILEQKADINMKDLLVVAPTVKRDLIKAIKTSTEKHTSDNIPLNFFEDDDIDTTAIYTEFYINDNKIKTMLDT